MQTLLCAADIARVTGGHWHDLSNGQRHFTAVQRVQQAASGALAVAYDQSSGWSKNGISPSTGATMTAALQRGVAGFVIGPGVQPPASCAVLQVDNTWNALRAIALANRDIAPAKRLVVTGSVGKTTYKSMTAHGLEGQVRVHAMPGSANLHVPVWESLASIRAGDQLEITEVSVASPFKVAQLIV